MKKPKEPTAADAAAAAAKLYPLGPQSDGAVVIRVPDDFHLMLLRKSVEKQEKNSGAAEGTLSALAEGSDPWLEKVQRGLAKLKSMIASARAPENQIADTPIGKEIAAATKAALAGEKGEQIDGQPDGVVWAPHVPKPRPKLGEQIRYPAGQVVSIAAIVGYDDAAKAFSVKGADDLSYNVESHDNGTAIEWRLASGEPYPTPRVEPKLVGAISPTAAADDLAEAVADSDALLRDAPTGGDDDDDGAHGSPAPATPAPAGKGGKKAAAKKTAPAAKPSASGKDQRSRNLASIGRPAPKPSAAAKKGSSKGGRR